jgi:hypothetical protein
MARLPPSGVAIAAPFQFEPVPRVLTRIDLSEALAELCPDAAFADADIAGIYFELQRILGRWHAEQGRPDTALLAADLTKMAENIDSIIAGLSSIEDGLHHIHDIELVLKLADVLSEQSPRRRSRQEAQELIGSFRSGALEISNACRKGAAEFKAYAGKSGRPKLGWYDDFKSLLFEIARLGGVEPRLGKDRITEKRTGWLIDAARKLELFLDPAMRSPDAEACGKRLERAKVSQR